MMEELLKITNTANTYNPFLPSRNQEWQLKEHPGSLLHPVTLQTAATATAAVLPVPGGAQPADQQHRIICQQPQITRDAIQVCYTKHGHRFSCRSVFVLLPLCCLPVWDACLMLQYSLIYHFQMLN